MEHLISGINAAMALAVLVAAVIHAVAQARKAGLTWLQTVQAAADAIVGEVEQVRRRQAKEGEHFTGARAKDIATELLMRKLPIKEADAKAAVEAAVSKLPRTNLVIRNERGQFAKPPPR